MNSGIERAQGARGGKVAFVLAICAIAVVGALLRYDVVARTNNEVPIRNDAADYFSYAFNLKHYGVYSRVPPSPYKQDRLPVADKLRAPGYPFFLRSVMTPALKRAEIDKALMAQTLVSCAVPVLVALLALLIAGRVAALLAGILTALSPHLLTANTYLLTESLFSVAVAVSIVLLVSAARRGKAVYWLAAALATGFAIMVRPSLLFWPLIAAVLLAAILRRPTPAPRAWVLVFVCVAYLPYGLWTLRGATVPPNPSGHDLKVNFIHHGIYPDFRYADDPRSFRLPYRYDPESDAISVDLPTVARAAWDRASNEPARYLRWYLLGKPVALWQWDMVSSGRDGPFIYDVVASPFIDDDRYLLMSRAMERLHWPLVIAAFAFCILVWLPFSRRRFNPSQLVSARLLSALLLYFTALHMVGAPFPRYAVPLRPELYVAAAAALSVIFRRHQSGAS